MTGNPEPGDKPVPELFTAVRGALREGSSEERQMALEFLAYQTAMPAPLAREILPLVLNHILDPDTQIRYFARKARGQLQALFPTLLEEHEISSTSSDDAARNTAQGATRNTAQGASVVPEEIGTVEILFRKIRLGSRYVAFEALERLTESGDSALALPLIEFLGKERDPFKISFLVKRLSRIAHPDIPKAIAAFFPHDDPRIVANAIEGLTALDVPEFREDLTRLAESPDNRIRGNAVRALHKYDPDRACKHLEEMLNSPSIALQDTGVFLLRELDVPNKAELTKLAINSKFTTIRLRALEIPLPVGNVGGEAPIRRSTTDSADQVIDSWGLALSFGGAAGLSLLAVQTSRTGATLVFLAMAGFLSLFSRSTSLSLPRIAVAIGIISCMLWGDSRMTALLGILAIWSSWPRSHRDEIDHLPLMVAWVFLVCSVILSQAIQGDFGRVLSLAAWTELSSSGSSDLVPQMAIRHQRFQSIILALVALHTFVILHLARWIPRKTPTDRPRRPYIVALTIGLFLIGLLNFVYLADTRINLSLAGISSPDKIFQSRPDKKPTD